MNIFNRQDGFTVLPVVLVLLAAVLGIGGGYYFYTQQQPASSTVVTPTVYSQSNVGTNVSPAHASSTSTSTSSVKVVSAYPCLPQGIKLSDVVTVGVSVKQKLAGMGAQCKNATLVDSAGKEIYFYHLTGCWGNPPVNYRDILQQQQNGIAALKMRFTVIELTCNPSGRPIP